MRVFCGRKNVAAVRVFCGRKNVAAVAWRQKKCGVQLVQWRQHPLHRPRTWPLVGRAVKKHKCRHGGMGVTGCQQKNGWSDFAHPAKKILPTPQKMDGGILPTPQKGMVKKTPQKNFCPPRRKFCPPCPLFARGGILPTCRAKKT